MKKYYNLVVLTVLFSFLALPLAYSQSARSNSSSEDRAVKPVLRNSKTNLPSNFFSAKKELESKSVTNVTAAITAGANYLKHAQSDITEDNAGNGNPDADNNDGGWNWVLTAPTFVHNGAASPVNLYGVTAMGLYYAYLRIGDPAYKTAMDDAANAILANSNVKDPSAIKFLLLYNDLQGVSDPKYRNAAKQIYDNRIAADGGGTATGLAVYIRELRGVTQGFHNGIITWDLGAWAVAAQMLYDRFGGNYHNDAGDFANVAYNASYITNTNYFDLVRCAGWDENYNNMDYQYYVLGLSGLLDAFRVSGVHTDKINDVIARLYSSQSSGTGGFSLCYGAHANDEDYQSTAYAVMALGDYYKSVHASVPSTITNAVIFLTLSQDASGAWVNTDGTHYPEVGGESVSALYYYDAIPGATTLTGITQTTASFSTAIDYNGAVITELGYCYGIFHNPDLSGLYTASATIQTGSFTGQLTGLTAATIYYVRPYIKTSIGVKYGAEIQITTLANPPSVAAPLNNATGVSILPKFQWSFSLPSFLSLLSYDLNLYDGATLVFTKNLTSVTFYQLLETDFVLLNNHKYTWTITANISNGTSVTASSVFTTNVAAKATLYTPSTGATVYTFNPVLLTWSLNQAVNDKTFIIQYINQISLSSSSAVPVTADWNNTLITTSVSAGNSINLNNINLQGGSKYWWRVITMRGTEVITYSDNQWFRTAGGAALANAIPSWPIGGAQVYENNPTCYWYTNSGNLTDISFDLVVSNNSGFNNTIPGNMVYTYHTGNLNAVITDALTAGATYYWKVITYYQYTSPAVYVQKSEPTGAPASFVAKGAVNTIQMPVCSYPLGAIVYTQTPTFYWYLNAAASGVSYYLYIDGTVTDLPVSDQYSITTLRVLSPGAHTWYVLATNGNHAYDKTSASQTFTVAGGLDQGKPVASWPTGNATIYTQTPELSWYVTGITTGLSKFRVAWSTTSTSSWATLPSSNYIDVTDLDQRSVTLPALAYGTHIYWAVAAYSGIVPTTWSTGEFTVIGGAGTTVPVLSYPIGGATVYSSSVNLMWYLNGTAAGIDHYKVEYSTSPTFTGATVIEPVTDHSVTINGLTAGVTYYWRVTSYNGSVYSAASTIGVFTIDAGASAATPFTGSPVGGVIITTSAPVLSWLIPVKSDATLKYDLQYSNSTDMSSAVTITNITGSSQTLGGLKAGQTYYWQVRSINSKGEASAYSPVATFSVNGKPLSVEDNSVMPVDFALNQNYPNPFNPTTRISYSLPVSSFVTLKIYDMTGREIKTLVNGQISGGNHFVEWFGNDNSGSKVASGAYLYRITAGSFTATRKLLLLK